LDILERNVDEWIAKQASAGGASHVAGRGAAKK
jgi:hypothetical protein